MQSMNVFEMHAYGRQHGRCHCVDGRGVSNDEQERQAAGNGSNYSESIIA